MIRRLSTLRNALALVGLAAGFAVFGLLLTAAAVTPDEIDALEDISQLTQVQYGSSTFNRRTGELQVNVTVTNKSAQTIRVPIVLVIRSISSPNVMLVNEDGQTNSGFPFVDLSGTVGEDEVLGPGEISTPRPLVFANPSRARFTFESSCLGTTILAPPPSPLVAPHEGSTANATVEIQGTAPKASELEVSAPSGILLVPVGPDGSFVVTVPLTSNRANPIYLTSVGATGLRSAPTTIHVVQDSQPPNLQIQLPADNSDVTTQTTDVAGIVSDTLSGFNGLQVVVNGIVAEVDVGIGTNGTFFASSVPLTLGENVIQATATDALGNTRSRQITVKRVEIPPDAPQIMVAAGNAQTGQILTVLPEQIVVTVTQGDGSPFANKVVNFKVTRSNGRLCENETDQGSLMFQSRTDATGQARACWRLGSDAGCGNNRVEVTSKDIIGTTVFCASATPAPPSQINVGSGNNQRGEAGAPAPLPLVAWVSDACNGVAGVPVTFTVTEGGGAVNGQSAVTVPTRNTGHAQVNFTLGLEGGNNRIEATFSGNPGNPSVFVVFGVVRDENQPTSLSGLVLDNGNRPVGGARCTVTVNGQVQPLAFTDDEGKFSFPDIPDGAAHLHVDGTVANLLNGSAIPPGSFPALAYELVIIPNAENSLPTPVLLPPLNPNNAVTFDNTEEALLTIDEINGLEMIVKVGSMTRADGSVPGPNDPAILSLNQVHFDDVPMPMPDGAAPPFAWTLQPAGAHFDPPIQIIYPNMSALPAGSIAYFLSFNHDTGKFEIIAPGRVSDDGLEIVSDPGTGITVAGWGCNCPPYTSAADCEGCTFTCKDPGTLDGGTVDVDKEFACIDDTMTFSASGVSHVGGKLEKKCPKTGTTTIPIAGTVKYKWKITGPETLEGDGPSATVAKAKTGTYNCIFTAFVEDPPGATVSCLPTDLALPGKSAMVVDDDGTVPTAVGPPLNYLPIGAAPPPTGTGVTVFNEPVIDITAYCDSAAQVWKCKVTQADSQINQSVRLHPGPPAAMELTLAVVNAETSEAELNLMIANLSVNSSPGLPRTKWYMLSATQAHEDAHVTQYQRDVAPHYAAFKTTVEALTVPLKDHMTKADAKNAIKALAGYTTAKATFDAGELKANNDTAAHMNNQEFLDAAAAAVAGRIVDINNRKAALGF